MIYFKCWVELDYLGYPPKTKVTRNKKKQIKQYLCFNKRMGQFDYAQYFSGTNLNEIKYFQRPSL